MRLAELATLLALYWPPPQAAAVHAYMVQATGPKLDVCANTSTGEGLGDLTGKLRGELHRFARVPRNRCVPAELQVAFLAHAFPKHYPVCARKFTAGDLGALQRCWGEGRSR